MCTLNYDGSGWDLSLSNSKYAVRQGWGRGEKGAEYIEMELRVICESFRRAFINKFACFEKNLRCKQGLSELSYCWGSCGVSAAAVGPRTNKQWDRSSLNWDKSSWIRNSPQDWKSGFNTSLATSGGKICNRDWSASVEGLMLHWAASIKTCSTAFNCRLLGSLTLWPTKKPALS